MFLQGLVLVIAALGAVKAIKDILDTMKIEEDE